MSIGSATYDIFVRVPHEIVDEGDQSAFTLPMGAKVRVEEVVQTCGGGASNTSVGLSRLGCDASFEGAIGADQWGEDIVKNFQREGVNSQCALIVEDEVTSFSIILIGKSGERVILYEPGTNAHLHPVNFDAATVEEMDWVYLNRIHEDACEIQDTLSKMLIEGPMQFTWNPGGCQIQTGLTSPKNAALVQHTDLLLLNKEEAILFTGTSDAEEALETLRSAGAANICITDGCKGTLASDGMHIYHCPALDCDKTVDTTGAGDAFGTGVTWGLIQGFSLSEALKAGSISAASVVQRIGAQAGLLTDTEMKQKLQDTSLVVETLSSNS